jgi:hypothetical protein
MRHDIYGFVRLVGTRAVSAEKPSLIFSPTHRVEPHFVWLLTRVPAGRGAGHRYDARMPLSVEHQVQLVNDLGPIGVLQDRLP